MLLCQTFLSLPLQEPEAFLTARGVRAEHLPLLLSPHPSPVGSTGPDALLHLPPLHLNYSSNQGAALDEEQAAREMEALRHQRSRVEMSGVVVAREWAPIGGGGEPHARMRLRAPVRLLRAAGVPWGEIALLAAQTPEACRLPVVLCILQSTRMTRAWACTVLPVQ